MTSKKKEEAFREYENRIKWAKRMLVNISKAGYFSSDRTIKEYNEDIWKLSSDICVNVDNLMTY